MKRTHWFILFGMLYLCLVTIGAFILANSHFSLIHEYGMPPLAILLWVIFSLGGMLLINNLHDEYER